MTTIAEVQAGRAPCACELPTVPFGPALSGLLVCALALAAVAQLAAAEPAGVKAGILGIKALPTSLVVRVTGGGMVARLLELRPYQTYVPGGTFPLAWEGELAEGEITVPRFDGQRDRLFGKLQLVSAETQQALGNAHWADDLSGLAAWDFAMPWPRSKKGVTCPVDLDDL